MANEQHAVALSGNGAYAAYELGILKALLHGVCPSSAGRPIQPEIYSGVSMGALSATLMVAGGQDSDFDAVQQLEEVWLNQICESFSGENGVFRWRADPFDYSRPTFYLPNPVRPLLNLASDTAFLLRETAVRAGSFLSSVGPVPSVRSVQNALMEVFDWSVFTDHQPLKKLVRGTVDTHKVKTSAKKLRIIAADWKDGRPKIFSNRDFGGEKGEHAIAASLVIPGVAPPEQVDTDQYVDGAVLMDRPLAPSLEARDRSKDADGRERPLVVHAIYVDPEHARTPLPSIRNTISTILRLYMLAFARSVNADVERIDRINRSLQFLELLRDPVSSAAAEGEGFEIMKLYKRLNQETAEGVEVEIHRYRSSKHLGSMLGMFQFDKDRIRRLIDKGFADAQTHDCERAQCIRPRGG